MGEAYSLFGEMEVFSVSMLDRIEQQKVFFCLFAFPAQTEVGLEVHQEILQNIKSAFPEMVQSERCHVRHAARSHSFR